MGMTPFQRFARVVVPLALPVSFAGVRTAATETIASATLATFVGAGGLGDEIVRGLQTDDVDAALRRRRAGRGARARRRPRARRARARAGGTRMTSLALARSLCCAPRLRQAAARLRRADVRVGSKNFTESFLIAEIYAQALERAGMRVERLFNLGSTQIAMAAMQRGNIDSIPSTPEPH